jgi:hypothetical protein
VYVWPPVSFVGALTSDYSEIMPYGKRLYILKSAAT